MIKVPLQEINARMKNLRKATTEQAEASEERGQEKSCKELLQESEAL